MSRAASVKSAATSALLLATLLLAPAADAARSHPVIAGSSTIFPFAAAVAERAPGPGALILPMGSGAGIAWFCEGLGAQTPDIVMASRAMTPEEASACRVAGASPLERVQIGWDGIVLAAHADGALPGLALTDLWRALAQRVPDPAGGPEWVANPYRSWHDIRPELPDLPIRVLGPPATSGTRDAFAALAIRPACEAALHGHPRADRERRHCGELRRDGAWVDAGENDDGLIARLGADPVSLGVVGFGALVRNAGRVGAVCLDGSCPDADTIRAGGYPLARPLYLYLKPAHRVFVPSLDAFVDGFWETQGPAVAGRLARLGLVSVPADASRQPHATDSGAVPGAAFRNIPGWIAGGVLLAVVVALVAGMALVRRPVPADRPLEKAVSAVLWSSAVVSGALLAVVLATLVIPTLNFFLQVSPAEFLGGRHWSPESAIRASQVVGEGAFGVLPVLLGSAMVAFIALAFALPLACAAAVHGHAWAGRRYRRGWRVGMRLAALVPAVVYGLFAALTAGPAIAATAAALGLGAAVESTLAAGIVVGIMLLPVLAVRMEDALAATPAAAHEAALGLGATRWEALRDIVLPAARPAMGAAVLLAVTRALGETVVVLMAAGLVANWTLDPLASTTTITAQMVALMSGTHELDNVRTQLPFVLGMFLAIIVLPLNAWALRLLRRSNVTPSPVF